MSGTVELFTTRMRKATRKIHSVSDALVNAKFAISLRDNAVWGRGLLVFYHVFAYLEDAKERLDMPDYNRLFMHETLYRKKAFESDLKHYLGEDWSSLPKSVSLENYIEHLQDLEKENPMMLMAYVYHLYLGLLSGGQILAKKRNMFGILTILALLVAFKMPSSIIHSHLFTESSNQEAYVDQVTDFSGIDVPELKNDFREVMNSIADKMTEEQRQAFLDESNQVFLMNNLIVNSVEGQNQVLYEILYKVSAVFLVAVGAVMAYRMHKA